MRKGHHNRDGPVSKDLIVIVKATRSYTFAFAKGCHDLKIGFYKIRFAIAKAKFLWGSFLRTHSRFCDIREGF